MNHLHFRLVSGSVPEKESSTVPEFRIVLLAESISSDVTVCEVDIRFCFFTLKLSGILYRFRAADTTAVHSSLFPGPYALHENNFSKFSRRKLFLIEHSLKFLLGNYPGGLSIQIL